MNYRELAYALLRVTMGVLLFVDLNRYSIDGLLYRKPAAGFTR